MYTHNFQISHLIPKTKKKSMKLDHYIHTADMGKIRTYTCKTLKLLGWPGDVIFFLEGIQLVQFRPLDLLKQI